jgi:hypothetical protein
MFPLNNNQSANQVDSSFFGRCRFPPGGKNRIPRKIKNVAEVSKVPLKIRNNSRRLKTPAENLNLQPNAGRSAGNLKLQRNN